MSEELNKVLLERVELLESLVERAACLFNYYADHHEAKGPGHEYKAERNRAIADRLNEVLDDKRVYKLTYGSGSVLIEKAIRKINQKRYTIAKELTRKIFKGSGMAMRTWDYSLMTEFIYDNIDHSQGNTFCLKYGEVTYEVKGTKGRVKRIKLVEDDIKGVSYVFE